MRKWDVVLSKSYAYYIHILHNNTMDKKKWFGLFFMQYVVNDTLIIQFENEYTLSP